METVSGGKAQRDRCSRTARHSASGGRETGGRSSSGPRWSRRIRRGSSSPQRLRKMRCWLRSWRIRASTGRASRHSTWTSISGWEPELRSCFGSYLYYHIFSRVNFARVQYLDGADDRPCVRMCPVYRCFFSRHRSIWCAWGSERTDISPSTILRWLISMIRRS